MMLAFVIMALLGGISQSLHCVGERAERRVNQDEMEMIADGMGHSLDDMENERQLSALPCNSTNTKCEKFGGYCTSSNVECDFLRPAFCSNASCRCCIDCDKSQVKSECEANGGKCRHCNCYAEEYHLLIPCAYSGCMCCQKCDTTDKCKEKKGLCVGDASEYIKKGWIADPSIECKQPECTCVIYPDDTPCRGTACKSINGYCTPREKGCEEGYIKIECGCDPKEKCYCCVKSIIKTSK